MSQGVGRSASDRDVLIARYGDGRTRDQEELAVELSVARLFRWPERARPALREITFDGPYRLELAGGHLAYLAYDGRLEATCPRQRPDAPLAAEDEWRRWWRHHPLSVEVSALLRLGVSIERASLLSGVTPEAGARAIAASAAQVGPGQSAHELRGRPSARAGGLSNG